MPLGVMSRAAKIAIMTAWGATGGPGALCTLKLFTGSTVPTEASVAADFTEPTGDWYDAIVTPVWSDGFEDVDSFIKCDAPTENFIVATVGTLENITGWFLVKTSGGDLEYAQRFDNPKPMGQFVGQGFSLDPVVVYGT
jgi:hypothetical protein